MRKKNAPRPRPRVLATTLFFVFITSKFKYYISMYK